MKKTLFLLLAVGLCGCASITQNLETSTTNKDGAVVKQVTRNRALVLWDAKQTLEKLKVSNTQKSQSVGINNTTEEASSTNTVAQIEALLMLLKTIKP